MTSIELTSDDGYIVGGFSASGISGDKTEVSYGSSDYWVLKLNNTGEIEWQNTIGGNDNDQVVSIQQTSDGGYIVSGDSRSGISGEKTEPEFSSSSDYWILKLDAQGNIVWRAYLIMSGTIASLHRKTTL